MRANKAVWPGGVDGKSGVLDTGEVKWISLVVKGR